MQSTSELQPENPQQRWWRRKLNLSCLKVASIGPQLQNQMDAGPFQNARAAYWKSFLYLVLFSLKGLTRLKHSANADRSLLFSLPI